MNKIAQIQQAQQLLAAEYLQKQANLNKLATLFSSNPFKNVDKSGWLSEDPETNAALWGVAAGVPSGAAIGIADAIRSGAPTLLSAAKKVAIPTAILGGGLALINPLFNAQMRGVRSSVYDELSPWEKLKVRYLDATY